jgi:hypothetical protein
MSLKFNSIVETNDPKENNLYLGHICKLPLFEETQEGLNKKFDLMVRVQIFEELQREFKVLCFSKSYKSGKVLISGYKMPRMWAQYGQNHTGVCIEFDKKELVEKIKTSFNPVFYGNVAYKSNFKLIDIETDKLDDKEYLKNFMVKNRTQIFFTKHTDWLTEREFRFLYCGKNDYVVHLRALIKGIYLGINFNKYYYPMIKYFNQGNNLSIFQMYNSGMGLEKDIYIETI